MYYRLALRHVLVSLLAASAVACTALPAPTPTPTAATGAIAGGSHHSDAIARAHGDSIADRCNVDASPHASSDKTDRACFHGGRVYGTPSLLNTGADRGCAIHP